jgi:hypothetical protein
MLSPDNELLFFTRVSKVKAKGDIVSRDVEELTEARRPDVKTEFNGGRALPEPFNLGDSYGGVTISVNNKEMFVTVCGPPDARAYRNCDIFRAHYDTHFDLDQGGQVFEWSGLENLGPNINTPYGWESQPSLSADGNTLYFACQRQQTDGIDIRVRARPKAIGHRLVLYRASILMATRKLRSCIVTVARSISQPNHLLMKRDGSTKREAIAEWGAMTSSSVN